MRPTAKHELFAQYLADGMTQAAAYLKAGFEAKTKASAEQCASKLLKSKPSIAKRRDQLLAARESAKTAALARVTAKVAEKFALTKSEVLTKMYVIYEMGVAAQPVLNSDGEPCGEYRTNLAAAMGAMKLLGSEMHGMFVDKKEIRTGLFDGAEHDIAKEAVELIAAVQGENHGEAEGAAAKRPGRAARRGGTQGRRG